MCLTRHSTSMRRRHLLEMSCKIKVIVVVATLAAVVHLQPIDPVDTDTNGQFDVISDQLTAEQGQVPKTALKDIMKTSGDYGTSGAVAMMVAEIFGCFGKCTMWQFTL